MPGSLRAALVLSVGSLLVSGAGLATEVAFDLTGTWQGILICNDNAGGNQVNFVRDDRVEISQEGDRLRFRRASQDGTESFLYEGRAVPIDGADRFEALVTACGGNIEVQEMVRLRRALTLEDGTGTFDAESIFAASDLPGLEGTLLISSCRYAYSRESSEDPAVPSCGP
jgi:hypothetical protein